MAAAAAGIVLASSVEVMGFHVKITPPSMKEVKVIINPEYITAPFEGTFFGWGHKPFFQTKERCTREGEDLTKEASHSASIRYIVENGKWVVVPKYKVIES